MSIYEERGYKDRSDYLKSVADECELSQEAVFSLAAVLGPNEDFDGLVTACQDENDRLTGKFW